MSKISQLSQYLTLTGLGILISTVPVTAATITFDLDFFDDSGTEIGDGQFSYDDEDTLTCVQITDSFDCFSESFFGDLSIQEISDLYMSPVTTISNTLTDFSASINGIDWDDGDANLTWWGDDSTGQLPGQISASHSGSFAGDNSWFFGDGFRGTEQFAMNFDSSSDTSGEGNWLQNVVPSGGGNPFAGAGTWQATRVRTAPEPSVPAPSSEAVPEPSTVFGVLIAMIFGYFSQRKSNLINNSVCKR